MFLAGQVAVPGFAEEALKCLVGLPCSCTQTSECHRQKRNFFPTRSESAGSFQHGAGITTVNLPVFQFLVLSSGFLLQQKAQMLAAL